MITRMLLMTALVLGVGGCRAQRMREQYIVDAFAAEARVMEDKLYQLDHRVDQLERRTAAGAASADTPPSPRRSESPRANGSSSEPRGLDIPDIPDLSPPTIDPGSPALPDPESILPDDDDGAGLRRSDRGRSSIAPVGGYTLASESRPNNPPSDLNVASIEIHFPAGSEQRASSGNQFSLPLVITPRNRHGEVVPPNGSLTVVVLDAVERQHVGRWEFDRATAQARYHDSGTEAGVHLLLEASQLSIGDKLHLFVRLETSDGQRFETDRPYGADVADRVAQRWLRRLPERQAAATEQVQPPAEIAREPAATQGPPPEIYR